MLIDPEALLTYDTDANRRMVYRDIFEHEQLVNRSDGVVAAVFIAGEQVWDGREFTPVLGTRKLGRALTAASCTASWLRGLRSASGPRLAGVGCLPAKTP